MWNPLSWVMEIAAIVSIALSNGGGKPPNWQDFLGIVILLFVNATISFIEERNAGNAVKTLQASLALEAKTKRNGQWTIIDASNLVPGDIISLKLGDVVPADGRVIRKIFVLVVEHKINSIVCSRTWSTSHGSIGINW